LSSFAEQATPEQELTSYGAGPVTELFRCREMAAWGLLRAA
jgi:hypothetical protein